MERFNKKYPRASKAIRYTGNAIRIAHQAYNMAKVVAAVVNSEKKYFDVQNTVNPDTVASVTQLTAVVQGDGKEQRVGDSIAAKSLQLEAFINFDSTKPLEAIRMVIFRDQDNAGNTTPTSTQLLEAAGVIEFRNKDYPSRFKVLYDKVFTCDTSRLCRQVSYYKKFKMLKDQNGNPTRARHITWNNDGADFAKGHLWLLIVGNIATASTTSAVYYNSRLRFMDN